MVDRHKYSMYLQYRYLVPTYQVYNHYFSMKRQNEAKLLHLSTTIQNNLQKLMSSTFQRTLQENVVIKAEVNRLFSYSLYSNFVAYLLI